MPSINPLSNALDNLSLNANRSLLDPKQYEGFTVKVGKETSSDGVLGGVLSQDDYDKFKEIVKGINVNDASYNDMLGVYRELIDAKLLTYDQVGAGTILGSVEFDSEGKGINYDAKYNQLEYQKKQLPGYAGSDYTASQNEAIAGMKLVSAIANASPVTGVSIAEHSYSPQERSAGAEGSNNSFHIQLSDLAQRLSRGEKVEELDVPKDMDTAELIKQLEQMAQAQRAAKAVEPQDSGAASQG